MAGPARQAMTMDVKTVCLGMLTDGPASGYDMKKCFESTFGHFFAAGYGSIYPALATLARNGLVELEEIPQEGKPDRKVYSITDKGREALAEGLSNPRPTHKVRSEFLAMMCFAHLMKEEQVETVIDTSSRRSTSSLRSSAPSRSAAAMQHRRARGSSRASGDMSRQRSNSTSRRTVTF